MSEVILEGTSVQELTALLEQTDARVVLRAIKDEADADIAIFLLMLENASHKLAKHASQILAKLPTAKQIAVAEHIATTEIVESEKVKDIYTRLVNGIQTAAEQTTVFGDGASNLVKLLLRMKTGDQNRLLDSLEAKQPELVNSINEQLFTFQDLAILDDSAIQTVLQVLDASTIALALYNAPPIIREKFLRNLSEESAHDVETEMGQLTPKQLQIAETARQAITGVVRNFAAKGMITIDREFGGAIEV